MIAGVQPEYCKNEGRNRWRPGGKRWGRGVLLAALLVVLLAPLAGAAKRKEPVKIGVLTTAGGPTPMDFGLRDGLVELGYREDEDFIIGVRFTRGDASLLPAAARDLVRYGVDIIFAVGEEAAKAALQATTRIPIVFSGISDPVELGLVKSFARPGGNITGVTNLAMVLSAKRLQTFRKLIPGLKRVLFPYNVNNPFARKRATEYRRAAQRLGIVLVELPLQTLEAARAALTRIRKGEMDGILSPQFPDLNIIGHILEVTARPGIPSMFNGRFNVEEGGLASYGPSFYNSGWLAARLVDKIIKGENPGEIPVEVDPNIEFTINLKVAEALGLKIAPEVLFQADRLIR